MIPLYNVFSDGLWADNNEEKPKKNENNKTVAKCWLHEQKINKI